MRKSFLTFGFFLFLSLPAFGQQGSGVWDSVFRYANGSADVASGKSVFQVAKPDMIIQVKKHPMGADMFEITAVPAGYPVDLLRQQAARIGELTGVPVRGLAVGTAAIGSDAALTSTKATFATNGIIDRDKGVLRIAPIIQAFAGAPAPNTVHAITILFNGEKPTQNVLKSYSTPDIRVQAVADENPPVVEYRIQLLTQDPKMLEVPEANAQPEQKAVDTASTVQRNGVDWSLWFPLIAGAAAAGVLVYFLMLRATSKPRR